MRARIFLALALALAGCAGAISAAYDPVLDDRLTALDARLEGFLESMALGAGKAEGSYRTNWQFYAETRGELEALRRRAARRTSDAAALAELQTAVEQLRKAHEAGGERGLDRVIVEQVRPLLADKLAALYRRQATARGGD